MQDYEETPIEVSTPKIHNSADEAVDTGAKPNTTKKKHAKNPNLAPVMKNSGDAPAAAPIPLLTPEQIEQAKASIPSQDMIDPVAQVEEKEHGRINLMPIGKENTPASQNIPEELAAAQAEAAAEAAEEYKKQAGFNNMPNYEMAGPTLGQLSQEQMNNQATDTNDMQFDNQNQFTQTAADEPDMFDQQAMPTPSQPAAEYAEQTEPIAPAPVAAEEEAAPVAEETEEESEAEPEAEIEATEEITEQVAPAPKPAKKAEAVAETVDDGEDDFEALVRQRIDSIRANRRKALDRIEEIENSMIETQNSSEDLDTPVDFREEIAEIMHLSQQISTYNKNIRRYIRVL